MIWMPSFLALSNLLPGFSPTKTILVADVTEDDVLPPWDSINSSALLREKFGAKGGGKAPMIQGNVAASKEQINTILL